MVFITKFCKFWTYWVKFEQYICKKMGKYDVDWEIMIIWEFMKVWSQFFAEFANIYLYSV
jgi:hypothetical protein